MIISRTPFRVSFFGGGTDYPDWYREHGGAVLATTIDKYCYISLRELPPFFDHRFRVVYSIVENVREVREINHPAVRAVLERLNATKGLEIHHDGDLPARAGLGSSSSFTVGLLSAMHALAGKHTTKEALANEAIDIEQAMLKEPVGVQDQISAAYGGFNHVVFRCDNSYEVRPMILPRERVDALQDHLMLFFTGISRLSSEIAQTVIVNIKKKQDDLRAIQGMVDESINILASPARDLADFGRLLHEAWQRKRHLSDRVSNATVDHIYETARRAGAVGGKLLGAGGGGFMLAYVKPEDRVRVAEALPDVVMVPFRFETSGCRIVLYQPNGL